jgi:hypothetical protein
MKVSEFSEDPGVTGVGIRVSEDGEQQLNMEL